jgi:exonuclease III
VRIATYNVNGINGRLANLLAWLRDTAPDIACLQELKAPDEKFPAAEIRTAGYGAVWHGQKAWNGVAILQRANVAVVSAGGSHASATGAGAPKAAMASSNLRRWPTAATPISRRSSDVSLGSTSPSISLSRKAGT